MDPDENPDDDDVAGFRSPLPPEDRIWRHPSEVGFVVPEHSAVLAGAPKANRPLWTIALVSGLIGAVLTMGLVAATGGFESDVVDRVVERERVVLPTAVGRPQAADVRDVVAIAKSVRPAIARLEIDGDDAGSASGSGVVFRDSGYLLTNHHVVNSADSIRVVLASGKEFDGRLVGSDPETDLAVVKIDGDRFPMAVLGSAVDLDVGEPAVAIGSPLGLVGGPSVTVGVVSALGRTINGDTGDSLHDMIQTDAPILPGSSGGALLDGHGAVIGITTAIAVSEVGAEGLGFATPIDIARSVADELIRTGKVIHVWLGIRGSDVDDNTARELGIDGGAIVHEVVGGSPAAGAGLLEDDVIVSFDGNDIRTMSALVVALRELDVGDEVAIGYFRDGEPASVTVTVEPKPPEQ